MKSSLENVTCGNCTHRSVCGKRDYMEAMIHEMRGIVSYSKYSDFKIYIECEYGVFDEKMSETDKDNEVGKEDNE